jgi:tetratricopeptide (TPR) repeat protein
LYAGIFAAWISFQAQSLISIENIALGIWGWILGGIIVGISTTPTSQFGEKLQVNSSEIQKQNNLTLLQPIISSLLALFSVLFVSMLYVGENGTIKARTFYNPNSKSQSPIYYEAISKVLQNKLTDPNYKYMVIQDLYESDQANEAVKQIKILINSDPINLDYLRGGAFTSERLGDYVTAIELRKRISNLDPWNSDNYLRLGMDYKKIGDISNMKLMLNRIIEVSPNHPIVETAMLELVS